MTISSTPPISPQAIRTQLESALSLPSRLGHTALLLLALAGVALIGALLLTEPALPARTQVALGLLLLMSAAWSVFAGWVLAKRRVLYAQQLVVAARMAIVFSVVFTVGSAVVGLQEGSGAAWLLAPATGVAILVAAVARLRAANTRVTELTRRRAELELVVRKGA